MVFIEADIFTSQLEDNLTDDDYALLQNALIANPESGVVIQHSGGLRKFRWQSSFNDKGKRGGVRVIYYYVDHRDQIFMVFIYPKGVKDDLSTSELNVLRKIREDWKHG